MRGPLNVKFQAITGVTINNNFLEVFMSRSPCV